MGCDSFGGAAGGRHPEAQAAGTSCPLKAQDGAANSSRVSCGSPVTTGHALLADFTQNGSLRAQTGVSASQIQGLPLGTVRLTQLLI